MGSRRHFAAALGALIASPAIGRAQESPAAPKRVVACLDFWNAPDPIGPARRSFAKQFAAHGLVDGRDIELTILRARSPELSDMVACVRQAGAVPADVILVHMHGTDVNRFLLPLRLGIPLVLWGAEQFSEDSIEALNRRGENLTGSMYSYVQLVIKRFELLKELRPGARRAALVIPSDFQQSAWAQAENRHAVKLYEAGARALGMAFVLVQLPENSTGDSMGKVLREERIDVAEINPVWRGKDVWVPLAANGIAASGIRMESARDGALLSGWTVGYVQTAIRLAAKVVRGQPAAGIPVERPMEYGLAINLATARMLGITVPKSLIVRADKVFE